MSNAQTEELRQSLWDRVLELLEDDLVERRDKRITVEVQGEFSIRRKEIAELSSAERRSLDPELREYVAEQLLDRYLAQQGHVDLLEARCAYTKNLRKLTPDDLPALIKGDQYRADEHRRAQEHEQSIRRMREQLERVPPRRFRGAGGVKKAINETLIRVLADGRQKGGESNVEEERHFRAQPTGEKK